MDFVSIGVLLLVLLTGFLGLFGLYVIWKMGFAQGWKRARSSPPACPDCHYDMTGLTHCRCPECGAEYKLDELWRKF